MAFNFYESWLDVTYLERLWLSGNSENLSHGDTGKAFPTVLFPDPLKPPGKKKIPWKTGISGKKLGNTSFTLSFWELSMLADLKILKRRLVSLSVFPTYLITNSTILSIRAVCSVWAPNKCWVGEWTMRTWILWQLLVSGARREEFYFLATSKFHTFHWFGKHSFFTFLNADHWSAACLSLLAMWQSALCRWCQLNLTVTS